MSSVANSPKHSILVDWLEVESAYNIAKFTTSGRTPEVEARILETEGILGNYWQGFIGSYYSRFRIFHEDHELRATQMLLKESATTHIGGICLRILQGMSTEHAAQSSLDAIRASSPPDTSQTAPLLKASAIPETPIQPLLEKIHHHITDDKDYTAAQTAADELIILEGAAAIAFSRSRLNGRLPAPGISSSAPVEEWLY